MDKQTEQLLRGLTLQDAANAFQNAVAERKSGISMRDTDAYKTYIECQEALITLKDKTLNNLQFIYAENKYKRMELWA